MDKDNKKDSDSPPQDTFSSVMSSYAKRMGFTNSENNGSDDGRSILGTLGGFRGITETVLPGTLFMIAFTVSLNLMLALIVATVAALAMTLVRLIQRQPLSQAFSGFFGVAVCVFIANRTGNPSDYYVMGLITNFIYCLVFFLSILFRWPLVGIIVGIFMGEGTRWRKVSERFKAYRLATVLIGLVFLLRLLVQFPLWLAGDSALVFLGTARIVMGIPLYALALWLSWKIIAATPKVTNIEDGKT